MPLTVDATGVAAPSLYEAQQDARNRYERLFGEDLTPNAQVLAGQLGGTDAIWHAEVGEALTSMVSLLSVDHAAGSMQDFLYGLVGVRRRSDLHSVVAATLSGVVGTVVAAAHRVRTQAGDDFVLLAPVTIDESGTEGFLAAVEPGPVTAPANTLTRILTPVPGWETITNAEAAVPGRKRETDDEYRSVYRMRTGRVAENSLIGLRSALVESGAGRILAEDNRTTGTLNEDTFPIFVRHVLVIAETGLTADLTRVVESHRSLGSGTMAAIRGGADITLSNITSVNNGSLEWDGTAFTGLNFTSATTLAEAAAVLNTALSGAGVTVVVHGARMAAFFSWQPDREPAFNTNTLTTNLGLSPAVADYPAGPFLRPNELALSVTFDLVVDSTFPADGLLQMRTRLVEVVSALPMGSSLWPNDLLVVLESLPGTRVSNLSVTHGGSNAADITPLPDSLWVLAASNIEITVA